MIPETKDAEHLTEVLGKLSTTRNVQRLKNAITGQTEMWTHDLWTIKQAMPELDLKATIETIGQRRIDWLNRAGPS